MIQADFGVTMPWLKMQTKQCALVAGDFLRNFHKSGHGPCTRTRGETVSVGMGTAVQSLNLVTLSVSFSECELTCQQLKPQTHLSPTFSEESLIRYPSLKK